MNPSVSVIICTHNPRTNYLTRVLDALKAQTLQFDKWELLLIDNASAPALAEHWDLSWHPGARCILEQELGLTSARLRGICEARGTLLVFVDDDNVLARDYLERTIEVAAEHPQIGAFGGSVKGEFETPPAPWLSHYFSMLAVREIERDTWSNLLTWNDGTPYGAGMCLRSSVANDYRLKALTNNKRRALGRVGTGTGSAEDKDMAYCAIDLGMGIGTFCRLKMTHIIPKQRLSLDYICRMSASIQASDVVLQSFRPPLASSKRQRVMALVRLVGKLALSPRSEGKIELAAHVGRRRGQKFLLQSVLEQALIQTSSEK